MRKISIHALLAESDIARDIVLPHILLFSIHALLAESDAIYLCKVAPRSDYFYPRSCGGRVTPRSKFLSTLSLRRATIDAGTGFFVLNILSTLSLRRATTMGAVSAVYFISIHALLAESDRRFSAAALLMGRFLSTLSLAESDGGIKPSPRSIEISIHALLCGERRGRPSRILWQ